MKIKEVKNVIENQIFSIQNVLLENPNGETFERYCIESNDVVHIIPYDMENDVVYLIREFKVGAQKDIFQFPAGRIDVGESPEEAAVRELKEEIGVEGELSLKLSGFSSPGLMTEKSYLFFCNVQRELTPEEKNSFQLDLFEEITTVKINIQELENLFKNGHIECLKSQLLISFVLPYLQLQKMISTKSI